MKIAQLLVQYLFTHKRLDLPRIGIFHVEIIVNTEQETGKQGKPTETRIISFQNDPSIREAPELIDFISSQTGKMKPLAAADLNSHLEIAQQFLNIGRPFLFEGIGTMVKIKSGYEFISLKTSNEKIKIHSAKEITSASSKEDSFAEYDNLFSPRKIKMKWGNPLMILLLLGGMAVAVWAGYKIYKHGSNGKSITAPLEKKPDNTTVIVDTFQINKKPDSSFSTNQNIQPGQYKFILEIANRRRAFERYNMLKSYDWNIQIQTKDSIRYTLFLLIPATAADTSRMLDSLTILTGRKVFLEHN
ncbi:MAG: hypothetical protein ACHQEB_06500 [Chitinophagales bacterium]